MKQGIRSSYWGTTDVESAESLIDRAKRLGFDVIELEAFMLMDRSDAEIKALSRYAADTGIGLTVGGGSLRKNNISDDDPAVRKAGIAWRSELIRKMAVAGIEIYCGPMYSYWPYDFSSGVDKPHQLEIAVESMRTLGKIAEDNGACLCVEVVNRFENPLMNTAEEGVEFCKAVGSPSVKLLLDTFHMNIEEDSIPAAIRSAGEYVGHIHTGESNRKLPGKGHLPWRDIFEALHDIGFDGACVMEPIVRGDLPGAKSFYLWRDLAGGGQDKLDADAAQSVKYMKYMCESAKNFYIK